jgi:hypothetical protein
MAKQKAQPKPASILSILSQLGDKWATVERNELDGSPRQLTLEQVRPHPRLLAAIKAQQTKVQKSKQ